MAYNYEYPYVDSQQFNIDWVLAKIKELEQAINVDAYKYIGENSYTDWNQAQPQTITYIPVGSLALNQAMEGASGLLFTNGNTDNLEQRFYAFSSGDRWYRSARNGVWLMWSNKDDDSSYLKGLPQSSTFNANNATPNTFIYAIGNPTNFPYGLSAGMCISYQTQDSGLLQIVYPTVGTDVWKRIKTTDGVWGQWMNVNDYNNFFKFYGKLTDANIAISNGYYYVYPNTPNIPVVDYGILVTYILDNDLYQIFYRFSNGDIWNRNRNSGNWNVWQNITNYTQFIKRINKTNISDVNNISESCYFQASPRIANLPISDYGLFINYDMLGDVSQLFYKFDNGDMWYRCKNSGYWGSWIKKTGTSTNVLLSTQHTNLYSTALSGRYNTMSTDESTKGSSFMHADTGYESFADAILRRELSDKDMVVTNLEMWDMDIPLNELTAKVSEVVTHIKETSPLTEFTLYSLPPIDVPFFGDELYNYVWQSGNTLIEVDTELLSLAEEMSFKYITWKEYKYINDNNLLSLYDDLFNNDLYQHSLQSYIVDTI